MLSKWAYLDREQAGPRAEAGRMEAGSADCPSPDARAGQVLGDLTPGASCLHNALPLWNHIDPERSEKLDILGKP